MDHERQSEAGAEFDKLERDDRGVRPDELHRFVSSRLSESEAMGTFDAILDGTVMREHLTERLSLAPGMITETEFRRLRSTLGLFRRWASDDAGMNAVANKSQRGKP